MKSQKRYILILVIVVVLIALLYIQIRSNFALRGEIKAYEELTENYEAQYTLSNREYLEDIEEAENKIMNLEVNINSLLEANIDNDGDTDFQVEYPN